jgi:hypothetical protein
MAGTPERLLRHPSINRSARPYRGPPSCQSLPGRGVSRGLYPTKGHPRMVQLAPAFLWATTVSRAAHSDLAVHKAAVRSRHRSKDGSHAVY